MNEQELGRYFESFIKTVLENNSIDFEYENRVKPKTPVLLNQVRVEKSIQIRHRTNFYKPDFILNDSVWIECTTKIKNAPKKELLYAHQCAKLIIIYLYKCDTYIQPYFKNTSYLLIDDFLKQLNVFFNYKDDLNRLRILTNEK
jgi:hypothetical protein